LRKDSNFEIFVKKNLLPCLIAYSKIVSSEINIVNLNAALLKESRSDKIIIRLASVYIISRLFKSVGVRYLCCLPDTVSILDEFYLYEDERVEKYRYFLKQSIEELIGEKIEDYLK